MAFGPGDLMSKRYWLPLLLIIGACSPRSELDKVIKQKHFIPFELPMPSTRVGTLLHGNNNELYLVAPPERCFPDLAPDHNLRWIQATDLPNEDRKISFDFNINVNPVFTSGNAVVTFKGAATFVKNVQVEFQGASVEFLDETNFQNYYANSMSGECKRLLSQYPFLGQTLRIEGMSFTFKDQAGANIDLTANLSQIVDISAGVKWNIENNYTLVISTPKYIGYRMARLSDPNSAHLEYASTVDPDGNWIFQDMGWHYLN